MFRQTICFYVILLWISSILCDESCEFSNIDFKELVAGIEGKVETSDPLLIPKLKGELPGFQYSLKNIKHGGLKDAEIIHMQCDKNTKGELTFQYYIKMPLYTINYEYEADGTLNSLLIEGNGVGSVNAIDYVLMINGNYEIVVGSDQKSRPVIKKHTLETDPQGVVSFTIQNLFHGDAERSAKVNQFLNENWQEMEKLMKSPTVFTMVELLIENVNAYSRAK